MLSCFAKRLSAGLLAAAMMTHPVVAEEMVLTSEVAVSHWKTKYMNRFAEEVEATTGGALKVNFFPAGQLYGDKDAMGALGTGPVQMVWPVIHLLESVAPGAGVATLPFAVTDEIILDACYRSGLLDVVNEQFGGTGIQALGFLRTADLLFVFKDKNIVSTADLKGLKVRISGGRVLLDTMKRIGVSPISMAATEMATALSQGAIDGIFTSPSGWSSMIGETGRFAFHVPGLSLASYAVLVDKTWYETLPENQRAAILKSVEDIGKEQWSEAIASDEQLIAELVKGGATVNRISDEDLATWKKLISEQSTEFAGAHPGAIQAMKQVEMTCGK